MKADVKAYVSNCQVCHQAKPEHSKVPGLLQPLPIPQQAWQIVSMDFIDGLPKSQRFDTILVVVDKFTKYGHFILCPILTLPCLLLNYFITTSSSCMGYLK
jgi:hypothetical protein